jgi:hypothetical protein
MFSDTCGSWAKEKVSTCGRKRTLTDSERKRNRSAVSSKWNKCRIYAGDQLDRWNEMKLHISYYIHHRHHHKFMKYEKRLRKEGNMPRLTYQAKSLPLCCSIRATGIKIDKNRFGLTQVNA